MAQRIRLTDAERTALARVAHQLWCGRMAAEGWHGGVPYDVTSRTHDGLVPFEALDPTDRWTAELATETSAVAEILATCLDYPRGKERIFRPEELRLGMRVALQDNLADVGQVENWEVERGRVTAIRVR